MLTKKEIERLHVNQLIRLFPNFFVGYLVEEERESPDFLFHTVDGERIGIEHTKLYKPKAGSEKYSLQETISLKEKVVEEAKRIFLDKYGYPLHVDIAFHETIEVSKKDIGGLALEISDLVYRELKDKDLGSNLVRIRLRPNHLLSKVIFEFYIRYFPVINDSIWQVSDAYFLTDLEDDFITKIVLKKDIDAQKYLSEFDKVVLLIVLWDLKEPGTWFDRLKIPSSSTFEKSCFEKIYVLISKNEKVIEIK